MIDLNNINFKIDNGKNILNDVNLKINKGEKIVILGNSGCGKTTLLKIIAGLKKQTSGNVKLNNQTIGYVFQNYALFPNMTVEDNIKFVLKHSEFSSYKKTSKEEIEKIIYQYLKLYNLENERNKKIEHLSGGEQQRVSLIRTLILKTNVILLDEPYSSIDTSLKNKLLDKLLYEHKQNDFTLLYVTHDLNEAFKVADKIAFFDDGNLLFYGKPIEMINKPTSRKIIEFINAYNDISNLFPDEPSKIYIHHKNVYFEDINKSKSIKGEKGKIIDSVFLGNYFLISVEWRGIVIKGVSKNEFNKKEVYVSINERDIIKVDD